MYARIVSVLSNSGQGTQDITFSGGTSFTPKLAIFQWSRANTSADTFQEHMSTGYGFCDGTNQRCIAVASEDNAARGDSARIQRNDAVICTLNPSGTIETVDSIASFSQWISNGIQINWTDAPAAQFYLTVLLIGGNDVSNIDIGTVLTTTGASASLSSLSWQPENGLFLSVGSTTENSPVVSAISCIGAYDGTTQWTQGYLSQDNPATMITRQNYQHARVMDIPTTAGATDGYSTIAWTSNGFTLTNTDTYSGSFPIYYLVWKGGTCKVGYDTEPAGTGQQTLTTNEDVQAVMVLGVDSGTAGWQTGAMWSSGMATSTTERYVDVFEDTNGVADSIVVSRHDTDQLYLNITSNATATSSTLDDEATFYSKSSTNIIIDWTNIGQARPFRYITFGTGVSITPIAINEDAVTVGDGSAARVLSATRPISDTPTVSVGAGSVTGAKLYSVSISEPSVSVGAEEIEGEREVERAISDTPTVSVSDSVEKAAIYPKPISNEDSISASDSIEREAHYTKLIDESQLSISDSIEGTKIPSGPTGKLWDVHFVEFPEDVFDSVSVSALGAKVQADKTHKYNIISKLETPAEKTHKYDVISSVSAATKTHLYNIISSASTTKTHKYDIISTVSQTKTHKYSILQKITQTRTHLYSIINLVSTTNTHKYNVSAPMAGVSTTKTHKYNVIGLVSTTKTHLYDVAGLISTTKTHKYTILNTVVPTVTKTHKYTILNSIQVTKSHKYSVIAYVSVQKTHIYSIYNTVSQTKTHKYSLIQKLSTTKTHKYNLSIAVSPPTTKTHRFNLLTSAVTTKTHKYNIIGKVTHTSTHKWNAGGKVTRLRTHKYEVGSGLVTAELGGSTQALIKFPERVRIVDIISSIQNLAISNVEIVEPIVPRHTAIALVELEEFRVAKTASAKRLQLRTASQLIVPQVQDTIENRAIAPYIAIEILESEETSRIQLTGRLLLQRSEQYLQKIVSQTQIEQTADTIIKVASSTTIEPHAQTRIASLSNLQLPYSFTRQLIKVQEIMHKEISETIKILIEMLKNDELFK